MLIPACTVRSTFGSMVITVLEGGLLVDSRQIQY